MPSPRDPAPDSSSVATAPAPSVDQAGALAPWFRSVERALGRIAAQQAAAVLMVGIFAFALNAMLSLAMRMPLAHVQDEFSYLLAADTFVHGRLSNPPHPLWVHFESIHIIQQPTYVSKYPPAQGLALAAGQVLTGHPIVGVWLSTALACAAICWMLMGWMTPRWALLGGLVAAVHPTILFWSQSYWGGSVAALGGALVLGALRRLMRDPRVRDAALMGLGAAILANSRPYEGLVLFLLTLGALLCGMFKRRGPSLWVPLGRIVPPIILILAVTGGAMGYYNLRTTGNLLRMPYMVHEETYGVAPVFLWQEVKPEPVYRHQEIRKVHLGDELRIYLDQCSPGGLLSLGLKKLLFLGGVFFPHPVLLFLLVTLPSVLKNRWMKLGLALCLVFTLGLLAETWMNSHYAAPITGLIFVLELQAMRHLRLWRWRGLSAGRYLLWVILTSYLAYLVPLCAHLARLDRSPEWMTPLADRARILSSLLRDGRDHLVVVRYSKGHNIHFEWVYNEADIDRAKVVWAREMDPAQNRRLLDYFRDRCVWLLEVDAENPHLVPYPMDEPKNIKPWQSSQR